MGYRKCKVAAGQVTFGIIKPRTWKCVKRPRRPKLPHN